MAESLWGKEQNVDFLFHVLPRQPCAVSEKLFFLLPKEIQLAGDVDAAFPQTLCWLPLLPSLVGRMITWAFAAATELFWEDQAEGEEPQVP